MPYIKQQERLMFDEYLKTVPAIVLPGELNYFITNVCHQYIQEVGLKYATLNEVIGVLECAKQELYRMVVAPYENTKQEENGCISELDRS